MELKKLALTDIRWGLTDATAPMMDGDADPIIVEQVGTYYDVIDGHHRVEGLKAAGGNMITAIIVTEEECAPADFAGGDMPENEWIDWVQDQILVK